MSTVRIDPLSKENYESWKLQAEAILIKNDVWKYTNGKIPKPIETATVDLDKWEAQDAKAKADLILCISSTELRHVRDCKTSREIWLRLESIYASRGPARKAMLLKRLLTHKMGDSGDIREDIGAFFDAVDKLESMDIKIHDDLLSIMLLYTLPASFSNFRCAIECRDDLPKPEILKVKILEEYESRNANNTENDVLYIRERNKAANKRRTDVNFKGTPAQLQPNRFSHKEDNYANERRVFICYRCNRRGHKASECREDYPKSKQHCNNVDDGLMSLNVSGLEECSIVDNLKQQWVLDSGCTSHLCNDVNLFGGTLEEYKGKLRLATNMNAEVQGRGLVTLSVVDGSSTRPVEFKDTLYVPDLRTNLISVAKITDNGYNVNFTRDVAVLVDKNGKVRLTAHRRGNLYCFPECDSVNAVTDCKIDLKLWHERLGHLNAKDVIKLLRKIGLDVNSSEINVSTLRGCDICARGKMTMLPFTESNGPCNERLRIVYSDIVGPMRCESKSGAKYFITFIDDSTRWCEVYFLKTKNKALEAFKLYKNYVEKFTGSKIKYFQSDNGGEYVNVEFDEFLRKEGIQRRLTVPRTPQQNGVAEKMNRTLVEMARCMLLNSDLCIGFWAEAIDTACYVRNRCPTSALDGDIPYEKWCQKQVNVYYLRRFGERVYVLDKNPNIGKFDARGIAGVFVGYSKTTKGFRVWIPEKRKFVVSRDIKFMELLSKDSATESLDDAKDFIEMISSRSDVQNSVGNGCNRQDQASVEMVFTKEVNRQDELPIISENVEGRHDFGLNPIISESVEGRHDLELNSDQGPENLEGRLNSELNPVQEREVVLKRGSGRPKVVRTGRPGRPRKVYNYVEVEERNSESETEEYSDCIDYAGAASEISLNDALRSPERSEWEDAILSEIRSLVQKGTWTIVKTPPNINVVGCRYVLTTKINVDKTTKKKARLVAQGFSQRFGVDYEKTFAPVARLETVRLMMAIAVEMDLEIHQVDINTAYLNGNLDEQIYMRIPRLLKECLIKLAHDKDEDPVIVENAKEMLECLEAGGDTCLLKKSLYGLKQAGRQWNIRFDKKLKDMGLEQSLNEPCLYMRHQDDKYLFVLVFVDDVLIASDCEGRICRFKNELKKEFDLKDYGKVKYFLGIDIKKNENGITLSQEGYVKTILEKFGLSNCNPCKTPSELSEIFSTETGKDEVKEKWPYRELIGSLMYLSVATRPDITNTVVKLAQFVSNPNLSHWKAAKRVLRYLKGTANYGLIYRKTGKPIQAYCDANWGSCPIDRKSYSGYCFILGGASISWSSRKQKTVATSTCEAEYVSLAEAFKEGLYLQSLLTEMNLPGYATISINTDSQSAMFLAQDPVFHGRSKHIDIKYHFIRGVLKDNNNIMLGHVPTESMLADVLTKALPSIKHNTCLNGLGLRPF